MGKAKKFVITGNNEIRKDNSEYIGDYFFLIPY